MNMNNLNLISMKNFNFYLVASICLLCSLPALASIDLRIIEPRSNGGARIVQYVVQFNVVGSGRWVEQGKVDVHNGYDYTPYRLDNFKEDDIVRIRVAPINAAGVGNWSDPLLCAPYDPIMSHMYYIQSGDGASVPFRVNPMVKAAKLFTADIFRQARKVIPFSNE